MTKTKKILQKKVVLGEFVVTNNDSGGAFAYLQFPIKWRGERVRLVAELVDKKK